MKFIRIFLLVLIVIGLVLLATQKWWVPKVVNMILAHEDLAQEPNSPSLDLVSSLSALYPNIVWNVPVQKNYEGYLAYDNAAQSYSGEKLTLHGYEITSPPLDENFQDFSSFFKQQLETTGWVADIHNQAGGAGSSMEPYVKGNMYVIVKYDTDFLGTQPNAPVQCPCTYTYSIFVGTE
jgi:hypothetical protein